MIHLAIAILLLYCLIIALIYGVLPSISDSFYNTGQRVYFTLTMMAVMFILMEGVKPNIYFIMGAFFLGLVGVAAQFKWKPVGIVHVGAVFASIILFLVGIAIQNIWLGLVSTSLILLSVYLLRNVKNSTWWREIAIIIILYLTLISL